MIAKDKSRYMLWPIRLRWVPLGESRWFRRHGWQVGWERCAPEATSFACVPGFRSVFGWTLHLGRLKVIFGKGIQQIDHEIRAAIRREADRGSQDQSPPEQA